MVFWNGVQPEDADGLVQQPDAVFLLEVQHPEL